MEKHTNEVEDNQMRALSWKTRVSYGLGDTACNVEATTFSAKAKAKLYLRRNNNSDYSPP